jgi:CRP/FNR family transcriptional regulator, anaerobic regulatory protein
MTALEQNINTHFGIPKDDVSKIASFFTAENYTKGDYFSKTGGACNKLSFVQEGLFRIFVVDDKREVTQWISTPGYFITDLSSLIFEPPARWNIQALTDCTVYTIHRNNYNAIGKVLPQWHELEKLFIAKCFTILEDRVYTFLSMTAEERYNMLYAHNKELFQQVPQQYIASMLGMSPETLSRIRGKR